MALGCGCEDATSVSGESDHFCLHAYNNHIRLSRRHRKGGKYLDKRKREKERKEGHVSINTRPRLDTNLSPSPQQEVKIQERTKKGESNNDSLTMGRAHTFPLPTKLSAATLQERRAGTWTTTVEVVPHASAAEQWVCYSRLAPWSSNEDGPCELGSSGAAADKAREVNAADCYFGGGEALQAPQGRWSMHVETAGRRRTTLGRLVRFHCRCCREARGRTKAGTRADRYAAGGCI